MNSIPTNSDKDSSYIYNLEVLSNKNIFNSHLIVKEDGSLGGTNVLKSLWEKIKGMCGYANRTDSHLVKLKTLELLYQGRTWINTKDRLALVQTLAERVGLISVNQNHHETLQSLVEAISNSILTQKKPKKNDENEGLFNKKYFRFSKEFPPISVEIDQIIKTFQETLAPLEREPENVDEENPGSTQEDRDHHDEGKETPEVPVEKVVAASPIVADKTQSLAGKPHIVLPLNLTPVANLPDTEHENGETLKTPLAHPVQEPPYVEENSQGSLLVKQKTLPVRKIDLEKQSGWTTTKKVAALVATGLLALGVWAAIGHALQSDVPNVIDITGDGSPVPDGSTYNLETAVQNDTMRQVVDLDKFSVTAAPDSSGLQGIEEGALSPEEYLWIKNRSAYLDHDLSFKIKDDPTFTAGAQQVAIFKTSTSHVDHGKAANPKKPIESCAQIGSPRNFNLMTKALVLIQPIKTPVLGKTGQERDVVSDGGAPNQDGVSSQQSESDHRQEHSASVDVKTPLGLVSVAPTEKESVKQALKIHQLVVGAFGVLATIAIGLKLKGANNALSDDLGTDSATASNFNIAAPPLDLITPPPSPKIDSLSSTHGSLESAPVTTQNHQSKPVNEKATQVKELSIQTPSLQPPAVYVVPKFNCYVPSDGNTWSNNDRIPIYKQTKQAMKHGYVLNGQTITLNKDAMIKGAQLCENIDQLPAVQSPRSTTYSVVNEDTFNVLLKLKKAGKNPVGINMANRSKRGGGVEKGCPAQEECLYRRSNYGETDSIKAIRHAFLKEGVIYTPEISVFREDQAHGYAFMTTPETVAIVAVAGFDLRMVEQPKPGYVDSYESSDRYELKFTRDGTIDPMILAKHQGFRNGMKNRIRNMLRAMAYKGHTDIVLGALGCGAFENPPKLVAKLFEEVFCEPEFQGRFTSVQFAVMKAEYDIKNDNFEAFKKLCKRMNAKNHLSPASPPASQHPSVLLPLNATSHVATQGPQVAAGAMIPFGADSIPVGGATVDLASGQPSDSHDSLIRVKNGFSAIHRNYTVQKSPQNHWQIKFTFDTDGNRQACIAKLMTTHQLTIDVSQKNQSWRLGDQTNQNIKELILTSNETLALVVRYGNMKQSYQDMFNTMMEEINKTDAFLKKLQAMSSPSFNYQQVFEQIKAYETENKMACAEAWEFLISKTKSTGGPGLTPLTVYENQTTFYKQNPLIQCTAHAIKAVEKSIALTPHWECQGSNKDAVQEMLAIMSQSLVKDFLMECLGEANPFYKLTFAELLRENQCQLTSDEQQKVDHIFLDKVQALMKQGMTSYGDAQRYIKMMSTPQSGEQGISLRKIAENQLKLAIKTKITTCANTDMALERMGIFLGMRNENGLNRSVTIRENRGNTKNLQLWFECPSEEDREKLAAQCKLIDGVKIDQAWQRVGSTQPEKYLLKLSSQESCRLLGFTNAQRSSGLFEQLMKSMQAIYNTPPIASDYTAKTDFKTQRKAHHASKTYLSTRLKSIDGTFTPISPTKMQGTIPSVADVTIKAANLPEDVVSWKITRSVQDDIKAASKNDGGPYEIFQVASQANGCEAPSRRTLKPGEAWDVYQTDRTQGPQAQMAFGREQVEIVNAAGNLGFNSLVHVFDQEKIGQVVHGYCTPTSDAEAQAMIDQISANYKKLEYSYIENTPVAEGRPVGQFLSFAPAFGRYSQGKISPEIRNQLEFSVALMSYRALFQAAINKNKPCIVNAAGIGLGVFENHPENVAKAFYVAIQEYKEQLATNNVQVKLNLYEGRNVTQAGTMANCLTGLKNEGKTFGQVFHHQGTRSDHHNWVRRKGK